MKKLGILFLLFAAIIGAQQACAEFRWGATAGVDLTTLKFKQHLFTVDRSVGPQLGVQGELMFPGIGFGLDLGAFYSQEGATFHLGEKKIWASQGYGNARAYLHYLQLPINLRFKWTRMNGFEDKLAPYVFGGPVFSFLCGHSNIKAIDWAGCSIGLQCGLGFELFRRWQIQGSYLWGVTYAMKMGLLTDDSAVNRGWSVRATYFF